MLNNSSPEIADNFHCKSCDYICSKQSDYNKHIMTRKHKDSTNLQQSSTNSTTFVANKYACECGKSYKERSGLWYHKNKCDALSIKEIQPVDDSSKLTNLVLEVLKSNNELQKQNSDLQRQILDICKNGIINNSITNVNSNNKTFNLQVFLHEDCKDAMNMSDFLESIKIQLADVECVGELGYVNGISKLIINNLKALDMHKRPVHCTDEKRETIYIKDAGVWVKDEDNSKLRKIIKCISNRNFKCTRLYKEKYPDCVKSESRHSDTYNKIVLEATGGGSKCNDYESENKIMKKIAKVITIDKSTFSKV